MKTSETEPSEPGPMMPSQRRQSRRQLWTSPPSRQLCELHHLFPRLLRQVHPGLSLSHEAMSVMDSFVKDILSGSLQRPGTWLVPTSTAPSPVERSRCYVSSLAWGDLQACHVWGHQVSHQIQLLQINCLRTTWTSQTRLFKTTHLEERTCNDEEGHIHSGFSPYALLSIFKTCLPWEENIKNLINFASICVGCVILFSVK